MDEASDKERPERAQNVAPLLATLLNLVIDDHGEQLSLLPSSSTTEQALDSLASWALLSILIRVASDLRDTPNAGQLSAWLWEITSKVVDAGKQTCVNGADDQAPRLASAIDPAALNEILRPIIRVTAAPPSSPSDLSSLSPSCEVIESLASRDDVDIAAFVDHLTYFTDFVHHVDTQGEEQIKLVSNCKESIIRALVDLSAAPGLLRCVGFWSCMREWLEQTERSDMTMCSLLCFGNASMSDEVAIEMAPRILDDLVSILKPSTPVTVQHALLGLLRNLSIPAANKEVLGEKAMEKVLEMDPWNADKDLVGSVQGGAVALIKNLCRDNGEFG